MIVALQGNSTYTPARRFWFLARRQLCSVIPTEPAGVTPATMALPSMNRLASWVLTLWPGTPSGARFKYSVLPVTGLRLRTFLRPLISAKLSP